MAVIVIVDHPEVVGQRADLDAALPREPVDVAQKREADEAEVLQQDPAIRFRADHPGLERIHLAGLDAGAFEDLPIETRPRQRLHLLVDAGIRARVDIRLSVELLDGEADRQAIAGVPGFRPDRLEQPPTSRGCPASEPRNRSRSAAGIPATARSSLA